MSTKAVGSFNAAGESSEIVNGTEVLDLKRANGVAHLSIGGTFTGQVDLEIRWNDESGQPWRVSDSFTTPTQGQFYVADNADYRLTCASLTTGPISYRVGA